MTPVLHPLRVVPALIVLWPSVCHAAGNAPVSTTYASGSQTASQNSTEKAPVLKVRSDLVLVDVVVTKNGAPVKGLAKDKFRVLENGKEQELKVFEAHTEAEQPATANAASTNAPAPTAPALPPNTYSDFTPYPPSSAANVLLLDALNTPSTDQANVRQQMLAYLKKTPPGTRMAVLTLSPSRLRMIQGVTADPSVLARAITDKGDIKQSTPEAAKSSDGQLADLQNIEAADGSGPSGNVAAAADAAELAGFMAELKSYSANQQEQMTLAALRQIAHYLSAIPGRKNLIWFSGSFPLLVAPGGGLAAARDFASEVRETDRKLAAARIAVYPVDARGLLSPESVNDASFDATTKLPAGGGRAAILDALVMRGRQQQASQDTYMGDQTIQQIAADTGGKAFVNTNDFQDAIKQALADGANYYTLGYIPQGKDDGRFRKIKVDVNGGYQLAYRDGYYADTPGHGADAGASTMKEAIQFGAPPPSEIPFKVRVISSNDPVAKGFTPASGPAGADAKALKPPVTRYLIDYMVDAHDFAFQKTPDGVTHARLEFAVLAYDAEGKIVNYTQRGFGLDLPPEAYAQFLSGGFPEHQELDLPAGQVFLRIVVHDLGSSRAGATEVPLMVARK